MEGSLNSRASEGRSEPWKKTFVISGGKKKAAVFQSRGEQKKCEGPRKGGKGNSGESAMLPKTDGKKGVDNRMLARGRKKGS